MDKINYGRVVLSGLVAGIVLNIGESLLNAVVLARQMEDVFKKINVAPPGGSFIAVAVVMTFILGLVLAWLYALIRPGMGPGPKTAVVAAVILWFCVYVYSGVINGLIIKVPFSMILIAMIWGLVEYALAGLAGGWLYKAS
jgi:hypothetical protein